ncbi:hypothetical protein [Liquorilactobacillus sicerae]|uniref:hypothetical protein n=1 Tax=Liquorilactobacillus sicerae TaxID=1416943 RepID=UPI00247FDD73|nr:hypothetical protein [Liquorilactobacillus sicerae]
MINLNQLKISFDLAWLLIIVKLIYAVYQKQQVLTLFSTGWLLVNSGNWLIVFLLIIWYLSWITLTFYLFFRILNFLFRLIKN